MTELAKEVQSLIVLCRDQIEAGKYAQTTVKWHDPETPKRLLEALLALAALDAATPSLSQKMHAAGYTKRSHPVLTDDEKPVYPEFEDAATEAQPVCPDCNGTGMVDSGGIHPWGEAALIPCHCSHQPTPRNPWAEMRAAIPPDVDAAFDEAMGLHKPAAKREAEVTPRCGTCHGTGQMCVGTSGSSEDGNAPVLEPCAECSYTSPVSVTDDGNSQPKSLLAARAAEDREREALEVITATRKYLIELVRAFGEVSCARFIEDWHQPDRIYAALQQHKREGE